MPRTPTPKPRARTRTVRRPRPDSLEKRVEQLEWFTRFAGANPFENIFTNGFEMIKDQLAPLRDLTPARTLMDAGQLELLRAIRDDLARPNWDARPERNAAGQPLQGGRNAP